MGTFLLWFQGDTFNVVQQKLSLAGGPSYREAKGAAFDFLSITKILCTPSQTPHPPDVTMILTGKAATASTL